HTRSKRDWSSDVCSSDLKLSENDRIRKEFISDVSHDFQSPLLNIKGYADLLLQDDLEEENRIQYAEVIHAETNRLASLSQQLLLLTSLDQLSSPLTGSEERSVGKECYTRR